MEDFNIFEEMLIKGKKLGHFLVMLAKEGDETYVITGDSNNRTKASVLIYDMGTFSLDWNSVYKSTKGFYIKKQSKRYYINN